MSHAAPESLFTAGVRSNARRSGVVGDGASWFTPPGTRSAYVLEVNRRVDALWRDIYQQHNAPEGFRAEFNQFYRDWQRWVGGLSQAAMLLPATEEHAQRVDVQIKDWAKRFAEFGGKVSMPEQSPPGAPGARPFPWKPLLTTVAIVAVVGGVIYVTGTARSFAEAAR